MMLRCNNVILLSCEEAGEQEVEICLKRGGEVKDSSNGPAMAFPSVEDASEAFDEIEELWALRELEDEED